MNVFIICFILLFAIISFVVPDPKIFLCSPTSAADAADAADAPNGIKKLLANSWITVFINDKLVFSNGPRSLPRDLLDLSF